MKKLKLELDALEVTTFTAEETRGAVYGMDTYGDTCAATGCNPSYYRTHCFCTDAEGCYPSLYCSQDGEHLTCAMGCMTNENGYC